MAPKGRVLLTEDDPRIRAAMKLVLEEEAYSVAERASGERAARPGDVVSREARLSLVWGYDDFGAGRLVDVHVRRLRTKVEVAPSRPRWIATVRGLGYKLQP